ncbi:hypothetical protein IG631_22647 [Alternaria alternata]|nr:hypothetical protein IG631_22647 [Alternaria alternata]
MYLAVTDRPVSENFTSTSHLVPDFLHGKQIATQITRMNAAPTERTRRPLVPRLESLRNAQI